MRASDCQEVLAGEAEIGGGKMSVSGVPMSANYTECERSGAKQRLKKYRGASSSAGERYLLQK